MRNFRLSRFGVAVTHSSKIKVFLLTNEYTSPPPDFFSKNKTKNNWSVTLHTSLGDLKIEVFAEANFMALCASGYYDKCIWHRLFLSPPSKSIPRDIDDTKTPYLRSDRAQFFILCVKQPHLDGHYTIIGRVIDGAINGTLDLMEKVAVNEKHRPVTIHANPIADKEAER
ncbi:hypothetical protein KEM48_003718 [Puccinia striiformis f. sp. tritici PST-130]|nr:hypothetical protein H4Q26_003932 [Puccinia striiformis f. sp. tritici PST-130]KAI9613719.1 hypothetical protein KEM48_003718 [Puccinia striiformis f. sp. tritici PST-130]